MNHDSAVQLLRKHDQEQVLRFYDELSQQEQNQLLTQIETLGWEVLESAPVEGGGEIKPIVGLGRQEIAKNRETYLETGKKAVKAGKVAAVLLAGGQGTRLGSKSPKGTFNIGLTKDVYIFQRLIENLQENIAICGGYVPLYIMTSEKNDEETRAFFKAHNYFGYPEEHIKFFVQDMAPCTDFDGKILLEGKARLATSPNGNGGWYSSLKKAGLTKDAQEKGVEWFNVFAVDNVLQRIADPVFVGATIESGNLCGAKVVRKAEPHEKVGVLCLRGGYPDVVEYYELTEEMANAKREDGELLYGDGVILNYLFSAKRLAEVVDKAIPVHKVKKKVPCIDEKGEAIAPTTENAFKYETLILDLIRLMGNVLPFEVEREKEFAPIKNLTGIDSVESARELLKKNGIEL